MTVAGDADSPTLLNSSSFSSSRTLSAEHLPEGFVVMGNARTGKAARRREPCRSSCRRQMRLARLPAGG